MEVPAIETVAGKAEALRRLHGGPGMLVLPNAWDAASAQVFERAGFAAIATTSGGVAAALGYKDHEDAPVEEMLAAARRIVRAVSVPVTIDFEAGYRLAPGKIAERLVSIGAAGLNLEDSDHHGNAALVDAEEQAQRLAAVKAASRPRGRSRSQRSHRRVHPSPGDAGRAAKRGPEASASLPTGRRGLCLSDHP